MEEKQNAKVWRSSNEQFRKKGKSLGEFQNVEKDAPGPSMRNPSRALAEETEMRPSSNWQDTFAESQFLEDLLQPKVKHEQRTSSPIKFKSSIQSSVHTDAKETTEPQSSKPDILPDIKDPDKVFGEIAYQVDRTILAHIFQGQRRLYGFTLLNIQEMIFEVTTHPLTGRVDQDFRLVLNQKHADLMATLQQLGYKAELHPLFSRFIVNTFGCLTERPEANSFPEFNFNNGEFLRWLILTQAPKAFQKDLQILLACLCELAKIDRKPQMFSKYPITKNSNKW